MKNLLSTLWSHVVAFFKSAIAPFFEFAAIFILVGCLANWIGWMYWPAVGFYAIITLGIWIGIIIALWNGIKGVIANIKVKLAAKNAVVPPSTPTV